MITVLGAGGFIGSHLVRRLEALGREHLAPERDEDLAGRELGAVIDCRGLTADFRQRPLDTVDAHVGLVERLLRHSRLDSLTYLSSTRVYRGVPGPAQEDLALRLEPAWEDDLYNLSKAMGESLTLVGHPRGRVARLSNVYGPDIASDNFLSMVLREVVATGTLILQTSLDSSRDYVSVHDVVDALIAVATEGQQRVYNVASGRNVSNGALAERLAEVTGCPVEVAPDAPPRVLPEISVERLRAEFDFDPASILEELPGVVEAFARALEASVDRAPGRS
jgi:nucleoside-diphosphate-sugar epimerase